MEFRVKLSHLPGGFKFPERLEARARYDAHRQELVYSGFMTKCTYDELSALCDDVEYHRALERLFVLTSEDAAPTESKRLPFTAIAAVLGAIAVVTGASWFAMQWRSADSPTPVPADVVAITPADPVTPADP